MMFEEEKVMCDETAKRTGCRPCCPHEVRVEVCGAEAMAAIGPEVRALVAEHIRRCIDGAFRGA